MSNDKAMSKQHIPQRAFESPALKYQSKEEGSFAYPARFDGRVPLKVKMLETVTSDLPMIFPDAADLMAIHNNEYYVWVNSYGAVTAILPDGKELGLKPSEFEVIEWHPKSQERGGNNHE